MSKTKNCKRSNPLLTYLYQQFNGTLSFTILLAASLIMAGLVSVYAVLSTSFSWSTSQILFDSTMSSIGESFFVYITLFLAFVVLIVIKSFRHLHKKSISDTIYSLPVTNEQRYLASCGSIVLSILLAFAAAFAVTIAVFYYVSSSIEDFSENISKCGVDYGDFISIYFHYFMYILAEMLLMAAFAVIVVCCCGKAFDSIVYMGILIVAPLIAVSTIGELVYTETELFTYGKTWLDDITILSPLYAAFDEGNSDIAWSGSEFDILNYPKFYLVVLAISAVLFAIAFFLHKLRRAEDIGTPVVIKGMQYLVTALLTMCFAAAIMLEKAYASSYSSDKQKMIYSIMLIGVFLAIEGIAARTRKLNIAFFKGIAIRFAIIVPLSFAAVFAINKLTVLSQLNTPELEDVEYISVSCNVGLGYYESKCIYGENGEVIAIVDENGNEISDGALFNSERTNTLCEYKEQEQIKDIMAFVDKCVDTEREYYKKYLTHSIVGDNKGEYWIRLFITVCLEDGSRCHLYIYNYYQHADDWARYYLTDELFDTYANIDEEYTDDKAYSVDETLCLNE